MECEKSKELEHVCVEGPGIPNHFRWPLLHTLGPSRNRLTFLVLLGTGCHEAILPFKQGDGGGGSRGCLEVQCLYGRASELM